MSLSDAALQRYARHIVLREIGGAGQVRLAEAHVVVIGAGGIGSPAHMGAELMLEASGVEATHVPFKGANDSVNAVIGKIACWRAVRRTSIRGWARRWSGILPPGMLC